MDINSKQLQNLSEEGRFKAMLQLLTTDNTLLYAGQLLKRAASLYPTNIALIYHNSKMTYQELYKRVCLFGRILKQKGLQPRDRVLICFENSPAFYIAYYAVWQLGGVVAPLNIFLLPAELDHIVHHAQPKFIITSQDRVASFMSADKEHSHQFITDQDMPTDISQDLQEDDEKTINLEPDEMAALLYTSGTTGMPKGVVLSSRNIITNLLQYISRIRMTGENQRMFAPLPLFHVMAQNTCVWGPFLVGCTVILVPKIDRRAIYEGLEHKPTLFLGVPALYGLLCLFKTAPLESVELFACGGDAMPDKIRAGFELLYRRKVCCGYGLTETSPVIAVDLDDHAGPTNAVGRPVVGIECSIRDEQGNECPATEIGTVWVRGDNVMLGYYNAPEMTREVLKDGWFNTGDRGYIDEHGYLVITGRIKDLIINKGVNIYPQEIENIILLHPHVIGAGVVGKKDEMVGEIPVAYVQLRKETPTIGQELKKLCAQHLASYKIPRSFYCSMRELPKTATAKVDKKILRKWANGELDPGHYKEESK